MVVVVLIVSVSLIIYILLFPQETLDNFHTYLSKDILKGLVRIPGKRSVEEDIYGSKQSNNNKTKQNKIQEVGLI